MKDLDENKWTSMNLYFSAKFALNLYDIVRFIKFKQFNFDRVDG